MRTSLLILGAYEILLGWSLIAYGGFSLAWIVKRFDEETDLGQAPFLPPIRVPGLQGLGFAVFIGLWSYLPERYIAWRANRGELPGFPDKASMLRLFSERELRQCRLIAWLGCLFIGPAFVLGMIMLTTGFDPRAY